MEKERNKERIPQLRFPEFKNAPAWEQRKLGNFGTTFTGLSGKTKEDFGHGEAEFVTYVNVFNNAIADIEGVDKVEIDSKQTQLEYGDVLFTTSSETPEEVGMSSVWTGDKINVYLNSFCFGYRPQIELDLNYFAFMLRSDAVRRKITFLAQGISRYNISKTKVMDISVPLPSLPEQKAIGDFFSTLDRSIALHQRELENLKNRKKSLLQKMFPKNGESVPEIRFPEFKNAPAWEQRKLGEVAKIIAGGDVDKTRLTPNGKYPVIANSLTNDGIVGYYNDDYRIEAPAVTVTGRGDVGIATSRKTNFTPVVRLLAVVSELNTDYLANFINEQNIFVESTGVPQLTAPQLASVKIFLPILPEQKAIGDFFSTLDRSIALHQRKLEHLKLRKKALLQKMFP